jgi:hypothetical protein
LLLLMRCAEYFFSPPSLSFFSRRCSHFNFAHFSRLIYRSSNFCIIAQRNQRIALLASSSPTRGEAVLQASDVSATAQQLMVILCSNFCNSSMYQPFITGAGRKHCQTKNERIRSRGGEFIAMAAALDVLCCSPPFFESHLLCCSNFEIPLWSFSRPGFHISFKRHPSSHITRCHTPHASHISQGQNSYAPAQSQCSPRKPMSSIAFQMLQHPHSTPKVQSSHNIDIYQITNTLFPSNSFLSTTAFSQWPPHLRILFAPTALEQPAEPPLLLQARRL